MVTIDLHQFINWRENSFSTENLTVGCDRKISEKKTRDRPKGNTYDSISSSVSLGSALAAG